MDTVVVAVPEATHLDSTSPYPKESSSEEGQTDPEEDVISDVVGEITFQWPALKNGKAHVANLQHEVAGSCMGRWYRFSFSYFEKLVWRLRWQTPSAYPRTYSESG